MNRLAPAIFGLGLILGLPLNAQILLDDFSTATVQALAQPGGAPVEITNDINSFGADREILLTAANPSSATAAVSGGFFTTSATGSGRTEVEYIGFTPLDLGENTVFQFNVIDVTGSPTLTLEIGSLESPSLLTGTVSLLPSGDATSYIIDITLLPGYTANFATQVNRIYFLLSDPAEGNFSVTADSAQLVPEPQTWVLLGLGLVLLGRRLVLRQKSPLPSPS